MALALTVTKQWYDGKKLFVMGTIAGSGSYVTGGDTLNLQSLGIKSSQVPFQAWIGGTSGYAFGWVPGTTQANGKVKISTTAATELAAGAYPAGITGDTNIQFEAGFEFNR
jgi:hypothetical protein